MIHKMKKLFNNSEENKADQDKTHNIDFNFASKPKSCPFCGNIPTIELIKYISFDINPEISIKCETCNFKFIKEYIRNDEEFREIATKRLLNKWNTRVSNAV